MSCDNPEKGNIKTKIITAKIFFKIERFVR